MGVCEKSIGVILVDDKNNKVNIKATRNLKMNENSYYNRHREERNAYQREYYGKVKEQLRRNREVDKVVRPEIVAARAVYQSNYYRNNRDRLLARKREAYARKKNPVSGTR